jgi:pimeloyl-ACP methyl ester carboxylesterase
MKTRTFLANGLKLNCLDYGGKDRPPILFVHGGSAHAHWWDFVAPHLTDRFHPLSIDLRGHGDSERPKDWEYGTQHYVGDLEAVIDTWGLGAPVLVGHSMGGHNVLVYATRHPEKLRAMVAIDSPPDYSDRAVNFLKALADKPSRRYASMDEAVENFRLLPRETLASKETLDYIARLSFGKNEDGTWTHKVDRRTMVREPLDMWNDLGKITCPALIVKIKKSFTVDIEVARKMVAKMPKGKLAEVDNAFHHAMLDNPDAVVATLRQFLAEME